MVYKSFDKNLKISGAVHTETVIKSKVTDVAVPD